MLDFAFLMPLYIERDANDTNDTLSVCQYDNMTQIMLYV